MSHNSAPQTIRKTYSDDAPNRQATTTFPSYLLQDVFIYLKLLDLLSCQRACRLWYTILHSRRLLRQKFFIEQHDPMYPTLLIKEPSNEVMFELHPIFSLIHFDSSLCVEETTFGRKNSTYLRDSVVRNHYATSPATTHLSLEVLKFHPSCNVENPTGITVWDVLEQLVRYKTESARITFQSFFGSTICNKRGYDRSGRMRHVDMLGKESVFISFDEYDPENNCLFVASSFESRKGARKGKVFRFWSAFAFCDDMGV